MDESSLLIDTKCTNVYTVNSPAKIDNEKEANTTESKYGSWMRNVLLILMISAVGFVLFDHAIFGTQNGASGNEKNDITMNHDHDIMGNNYKQAAAAASIEASKESKIGKAGKTGLAGREETEAGLAAEADDDDSSSSSSSPNIIFILMDDMGFSDMSGRGGEFTTPVLDSLYSCSIIIDNHYIGLVCSPSRSQIITGRYAWNMGISEQMAFGEQTITTFPSALPTIGNLLSEYGNYDTYFLGKWHMGYSTNEHLALSRGFKKFHGFYTSNINYTDKTTGYSINGDDSDIVRYIDWRDMDDVDYDTQYEYSTYVTGDKLLDIIETHINSNDDSDKSFYIHAAFQGFHSALDLVSSENDENCDIVTKAYEISHSETGPDGSEMSINFIYENEDDYYFDKENGLDDQVMEPVDNDDTVDSTDYTDEDYYIWRLRMCQSVLAFDQVLGDIVDNLKDNDIWDDTLIIFTSDNGAAYNSGGCNYPLRGTKDSFFEGGIRTLAFLTGGYITSSITTSGSQITRTDRYMHGTDWVPTILGFAGLDVDSISLSLQNKLYIPIAQEASKNENDGNEDYYLDYLMSDSFDGNDLSLWLLTGDSDLNPRIDSIPLSINNVDTSISCYDGVNGDDYPDNDISILFTSTITNNLYKFMYLNSEVKHGQRQVHYCTYRNVIDDTSGEKYKQRTQTVSSFASTNVFLFDLTLDYKESTNLFELLLDTSEEEDTEDDTERRRLSSTTSITSLDDYDSDTVSSLWDEALLFINDEYISNNAMFNQHTGCQRDYMAYDESDPSIFNNSVSPFYTWNEYTEKFNQLCENSINPVLNIMFTTQYSDY